MSNLTLIQINSIKIYIDNTNVEQKSKESAIRENYEYLEQNINTGTFNSNDSKEVSKAVNKIIVDFKFLFEENFKSTNHNKELILDSALGILRKFKEYLNKELINSTIFESFSKFVLEKINLLGNIYNNVQNKLELYENVCIYEILEKENLCSLVYQQSSIYFNRYTVCNKIFSDDVLDKYHSMNYLKVLRKLLHTDVRNPNIEAQLYFKLIKQFNEILDYETDPGKFLLENMVVEVK